MKEKYNVYIKGIDIDAAACRYAKKNGLDIENGDARKMPFPDDSFDFVVSRHFLEEAYLDTFPRNSTEPMKNESSSYMITDILKEIHRTLKPGGVFISYFEIGIDEETLRSTPFSQGQILKFNNPNAHVYVLVK